MEKERIDRLEERVDRLEVGTNAAIQKMTDGIDSKLAKIFEKLDTLALDGVRHACPSPGACIGLSQELTHAVKYLDANTKRVERLELEILKIERNSSERISTLESDTNRGFHKIEVQKAWVFGAWSVVAFLAAVVGAIGTILANYYLGK